jgi:hypothetical protein
MHSGQVFTFDDTHQNFTGALGVASLVHAGAVAMGRCERRESSLPVDHQTF